jgi:Glycosyl transferase family 2
MSSPAPAGSLRAVWLGPPPSLYRGRAWSAMPPALRAALQARGLPEGGQSAVAGSPRQTVALSGARSWGSLERMVRSVAPAQPPESLLALTLTREERRCLAGERPLRELVHLLLLRSGYAQVWAHAGEPLCVTARRVPQAGARLCSIIVPVYNEKDTFPELMRRLLHKSLGPLGLAREIILVESASSDGTHEQVASFVGAPEVRVLWQDRPLGKGHAVRAALKIARGDIVLIQDADLEYDLEDYDALLAPLLVEEAALVLGGRHGGDGRRGVRGPVRALPGQPLRGALLDLGHVGFTALINGLYGQALHDPFTMFKVFRRDCLYGLEFECRRFDFDHELLIKLLLKGYRPLEIPVSYRSRSFKQGKKIRPWPDALSWVIADLKYRVQPLRPHFDD